MQTLADMAEKQTAGGPHRVLVATESVAGDVSLASWLEGEGFEVMTAIDEQEALQIASTSWQPDVVLLEPTPPN
jgi:CheY-like chemotaxis protein